MANCSPVLPPHSAGGEHETEEDAHSTVEFAQLEALLEGWPDAPKRAVRQIMDQYGVAIVTGQKTALSRLIPSTFV